MWSAQTRLYYTALHDAGNDSMNTAWACRKEAICSLVVGDNYKHIVSPLLSLNQLLGLS